MDDSIRLLKKYSNRKLYDTHISAYVTLEEIAQVIREQSDVKVVDNATKEDITWRTLIQLIHEQERKSATIHDVDLLRKVICSKSGTFTGYIQELENDLINTGPEAEKIEIPKMPAMESGAIEVSDTALQ